MEDCSHFNKTPVSYIRSLRSQLPGKKVIRPRGKNRGLYWWLVFNRAHAAGNQDR